MSRDRDRSRGDKTRDWTRDGSLAEYTAVEARTHHVEVSGREHRLLDAGKVHRLVPVEQALAAAHTGGGTERPGHGGKQGGGAQIPVGGAQVRAGGKEQLPAAIGPEKEGTFTNTQRLIQWHDKVVEPPGDGDAVAELLEVLAQQEQAAA